MENLWVLCRYANMHDCKNVYGIKEEGHKLPVFPFLRYQNNKMRPAFQISSCLMFVVFLLFRECQNFLVSICKMLDLWGFMKKLAQKF